MTGDFVKDFTLRDQKWNNGIMEKWNNGEME